MRNFLAASEAGDAGATGLLSGRLLETLREAGKLTGEIARIAPNQTTINNISIVQSPQFNLLIVEIIGALRPFPEAQAVVAKVMRGIQMQDEPASLPPMIDATPLRCEPVEPWEGL